MNRTQKKLKFFLAGNHFAHPSFISLYAFFEIVDFFLGRDVFFFFFAFMLLTSEFSTPSLFNFLPAFFAAAFLGTAFFVVAFFVVAFFVVAFFVAAFLGAAFSGREAFFFVPGLLFPVEDFFATADFFLGFAIFFLETAIIIY